MSETVKKQRGFTSDQDKELAKINGRKGGIKSGETKRARKEMRERLKDLFNMTIDVGKEEEFCALFDSNGKNITVQDAILIAQIQAAMNGNTKAAEFIRDTAGMKPVDKQEIKTEISSTGKLGDILEELQKKD